MMTPMVNNGGDDDDDERILRPSSSTTTTPRTSNGSSTPAAATAAATAAEAAAPLSGTISTQRRRRRKQQTDDELEDGLRSVASSLDGCGDKNDNNNHDNSNSHHNLDTSIDNHDNDDDDPRHKRKNNRPKHRTKRQPLKNKEGTNPTSGGSVLWTILVIGLIFCLLDVIYIIARVDRQTLDTQHNAVVLQQQQQPRSALVSSPNLLDLSKDGLKPANRNSIPQQQSEQQQIIAKQPIIDKILRAGIQFDLTTDDGKALLEELPTWSEVVELYGDKPQIYGLDHCQAFQQRSDPAEHFVSTAGTFNSGTNLMAELLIANCHNQARMEKYGQENRGVRWQVPWGKHTPPGDEAFRQEHKTSHDKYIDANNILPAVTIRDPLIWLKSMCRHKYATKWDIDPTHCPNFSDTPEHLATSVKYFNFTKEHPSILYLWNDYYRQYLEASFPRLIVRFEDLVFHAEQVTKTVCECAGGSMRRDGKFEYVVNSAKKGIGAHGKERTGYVDAIVKYGSSEKRYHDYHYASDLAYVRDHADAELMQLMNYAPPDLRRAKIMDAT